MNIDTYIDHFGTTVTLKTVAITDDDSVYGTVTESFNEADIKVFLAIPEEDDKLVKQGILDFGDLKATLKSDQPVSEGNIIVHNNIDWEVVSILEAPYQAGTLYKMVGLKKRL